MFSIDGFIQQGRAKVAESAIEFALNAFWVAIFGAIGGAVYMTYAFAVGASPKWIFAAGGAVSALLLVVVLTIIIVRIKRGGQPSRIGKKGYFDSLAETEGAISILNRSTEMASFQINAIAKVTHGAQAKLENISGITARNAQALANTTARKLRKPANLLLLHADEIASSTATVMAGINLQIEFATAHQQQHNLASIKGSLVTLSEQLPTVVSSLGLLQQSTSQVRWVTSDLDLVGGDIERSIGLIVGRLQELNVFCSDKIKVLS